jgi:hypothetical protein
MGQLPRGDFGSEDWTRLFEKLRRIPMRQILNLAFICGMALFAGVSAGAFVPQSGNATPGQTPASGSAAPAATSSTQDTGKMNADTPEDDAALKLTDEQKAQIKAIRVDAKASLQSAQKDSSLSDTEKQQKLKQIRKDTRRQVWAVMTPDQQKQWAAEQRERREAKHSSSTPEDEK